MPPPLSGNVWDRRSLAALPANSNAQRFNVLDYGAKPDDPTNDFSQAFYNIITAATARVANEGALSFLTRRPVSIKIYVPAGKYYCSTPLCIPNACEFYGDGPNFTIIMPGQGGASGGNPKSFSGPVILTQPVYYPADLPGSLGTYGSPAVGAVGQSIVLDNFDNYYLDDAWAWSVFPGGVYTTTSLSIQLWFKITDSASPSYFHSIVSSLGPINQWGLRTGDPDLSATDCAYGIFVKSDGVNTRFKCCLTTNSAFDSATHMQPTGTQTVITSSPVTLNTWHYLEMSYDGGHVDFYVDGVNQGHVAAGGAVVRAPWEGVTFGSGGPHSMLLPLPVRSAAGSLFSLRLSDNARHTGTGSYTPPTSAHSWDANTIALYNFDQGFRSVQPKKADGTDNGSAITLPFIVGQVRTSTGPGFQGSGFDGPLPHYIMRVGPFSSVSNGGQTWNSYIHDLAVNGYFGCSGVVAWLSPEPIIQRCWASDVTRVGIAIETTSSFYGEAEDIRVWSAAGTGIFGLGNFQKCLVGDCGLGYWLNTGGQLELFHNQPSYRSYAHLFLNEGSFVGDSNVKYGDYDTEVFIFTRQVSCLLVDSQSGSVTFEGNIWNSALSSTPAAIYFHMPQGAGAQLTHIGDVFYPDTGNTPTQAPSVIQWYYGDQPPAKALFINSKITDNNIPPIPVSNVEGWIAGLDGGHHTNLSGLSVGDTPAQNLGGDFTVTHGTTSGGPLFFTSEPDTNYAVVGVVVNGYTGSAPAAGSTRIKNIVKRIDGFTAEVEADPGGTCEITFGYQILRKTPAALLTVDSPSVGGTVANPFAGTDPTRPFAAGVTIIPVTGNCFQETTGALSPQQSLFNCGTTALGTDWWELSLPSSLYENQYFVNSTEGRIDSFVVDGHLCGILNPGAHNLVFYYGGGGGKYVDLWVDGHKIHTQSNAYTLSAQGSTIRLGQRPGPANVLSVATLSKFKMDRIPTRCVTSDSRIGPGTMAQAAFVGDDWVMGYAANIGTGFAQQIANGAYGTTYYWMNVLSLGRVTDNLQTTFVRGLVDDLWIPWAGAATAPPLTAVCIVAGWTDMWYQSGQLATDVWAKIKQMIEGTKASAVWTPPTSTTSPSDQRAIGYFGVQSSGTAVLTVNGNAYSIPFNTDRPTTVASAITQLNATGSFNANFIAGTSSDPGAVQITAKVAGTAGNAYVFSTDGAGGALIFGDFGGITHSGLGPANLFGGVDNLLRVAGVDFVCNFDTNADTTVNNVKALINADPTAGALVTATLDAVNHKMVITANTAGLAGNSISCFPSVQRNYVGTPVATAAGIPTTHLAGGGNGTDQMPSISTVVLCTVPPMKGVGGPYTAGKEAQRVALNASISGYVHAGVTIYDLDALVRDPGDHTQLLPAYAGPAGYMNNAGHNAVKAALDPLLP